MESPISKTLGFLWYFVLDLFICFFWTGAFVELVEEGCDAFEKTLEESVGGGAALLGFPPDLALARCPIRVCHLRIYVLNLFSKFLIRLPGI